METESESNKWTIAWIGFFSYFAILTIVFLVLHKDDLNAPISRTTFLFLSPPLIFLAINSHFTGVAPGRFVNADRATDPFTFWLLTSFLWIAALACMIVGLGAALGHWK
jgi:hypothetical protein